MRQLPRVDLVNPIPDPPPRVMWDETHDMEPRSDPARGILLGVAIGAAMWGVVLGVWWIL